MSDQPAENLNLGCGYNTDLDFVNLDRSANVGAEIVWNLEKTPLPAQSSRFKFILASHVLEHIQNIVPLMRELHRVLKPGGYLVAMTPYATSDDAFEDPTHCRYFNEMSWHYFNKATYEGNNAGHYDSGVDFAFEVEQVVLVPRAEFQNDPQIEFKRRYWRNVIQEMQVTLRKA